MNVFYAPVSQIQDDVIELRDQEATHASKALRYRQGDEITVVDGEGGWYKGRVQLITKQSVRIVVDKKIKPKQPQLNVILGMGIIKKRDRLEFAVEKAVELGVKEIALFKGDHTIKKNVRVDRVESIVLSAMKQSLQCWLPKIKVFHSLQQLVDTYPDCRLFAAHQKGDKKISDLNIKPIRSSQLLIVGPEGGLSMEEVDFIGQNEGQFIILSRNRLRTETAAISFLNSFNS